VLTVINLHYATLHVISSIQYMFVCCQYFSWTVLQSPSPYHGKQMCCDVLTVELNWMTGTHHDCCQ